MDLEKLNKMAKLFLKKLSSHSVDDEIYYYRDIKAEFTDLMNVACTVLPEHNGLFVQASTSAQDYGGITVSEACNVVRYLLEIIEIEMTSEKKVETFKIFEGAEEKLKQASLSFRKDDYTSAFHNLNTGLELVLKDKIGIPSTITSINISNVMDVLTKNKVEPYLYLEEVRKHVLVINNKIKHQGYCPSKIDCINGIKAMEELIAKLRNTDIKLTEEIRNKIYEGL
jgi:HEPN domain-containing protein